MSATAPDVWTYEVSDEWPIQGGEAAQGTSGVKQAITAGNGAIGFLDASQADGLGQVAVGVGEEFVPYSAEAASKLVEGSPLAEGRGEADLVFDVDPAAAADGAYPIALVSYLIGCEQYEDSKRRGAREGVLLLHRERRGPGCRRGERRQRPDLGRPARAGAGRDRPDPGRLIQPIN